MPLGAITQIVVSGAAVYVAWAANKLAAAANKLSESNLRLGHDAAFLGAVLPTLLNIAGEANRTRQLYLKIFEEYGGETDRTVPRTVWLERREHVAEMLAEVVILFPEFVHANDEWIELERADNEASFVFTAAAITAEDADTERQRYERLHARFISALKSCCFRVRSGAEQELKRARS